MPDRDLVPAKDAAPSPDNGQQAGDRLREAIGDDIFLVETRTSKVLATGTGWLGTDGRLITNYHVIRHAVRDGGQVFAVDQQGKRYELGKNAVIDPMADLAALDFVDGRPPAKKFDVTDQIPRYGESLTSIGHPNGGPLKTHEGHLTNWTTNYNRFKSPSTIRSVVRDSRGIAQADRQSLDEFFSLPMFNVNFAAEEGNSGGPVMDKNRRVVGVVTSESEEDQTLIVPSIHIKSLLRGDAPDRQFAINGDFENGFGKMRRLYETNPASLVDRFVPEGAVLTGTTMRLAGVRPQLGLTAAGVGLGLRSLGDVSNFVDAPTGRHQLKYGLAMASDATALAGLASIAMSASRAYLRRAGIGALAVGMGGRLLCETIPTDYVLKGARRLDGSNEPVFDVWTAQKVIREADR